MPIRPENRRFYEGEPWQATRRLVLRRAEDRCECLGECGRHRDYRCNRANRSDYRAADGRLVRVILSVCHTDHDPTHQDPARLKAMCQACHTGYDEGHHRRNRALTARAALRNGELFE